MTTANSIIERAMVKARIISPGESVPSRKINQVLEDLNDMLESWSLEGLMIPCDVLESFTLTAGREEYTYGSGGNFDSERPTRIKDETYIRIGYMDYPLKLYPLDVYRRRRIKSSAGIPEMMSYHPEFPLGKVFIWPVPTSESIAFSLISAGAAIYTGTGVFNSTTGVTINIGATLGASDYVVTILPITTDPAGVGPISVENKTTTTFKVYNTGADTTTPFDWILVYGESGMEVSISAGVDIYFRSSKLLSSFALPSTDVTLPPGYLRAIIGNLALEIAPNFGKKADSMLIAVAKMAKDAIKSYNVSIPKILANPDLARMVGRGGGYNILQGA